MNEPPYRFFSGGTVLLKRFEELEADFVPAIGIGSVEKQIEGFSRKWAVSNRHRFRSTNLCANKAAIDAAQRVG